MYDIYVSPASELYHHGIKGMKWGVRRYQNPDGSLTDEGRRRYLKGYSRFNYESNASRKYAKKYGEDSEKYKKSRELDEKMASNYRNSSGAGRVVRSLLLGGTGENTYQMSRASGRGKVESFARAMLDISAERALSVAASIAAGAAVKNVADYVLRSKALADVASKTPEQLQGLLDWYKGYRLLETPPGTGANITTANVKIKPTKPVSPYGGYQTHYYAPTANPGIETARNIYKLDALDSAARASNAIGKAGKVAGAAAAIPIGTGLAAKGREWSAQQAWIRNNYVNKGSVQEQKSRRQEERERKRAARRSN